MRPSRRSHSFAAIICILTPNFTYRRTEYLYSMHGIQSNKDWKQPTARTIRWTSAIRNSFKLLFNRHSNGLLKISEYAVRKSLILTMYPPTDIDKICPPIEYKRGNINYQTINNCKVALVGLKIKMAVASLLCILCI